MMAGTVEQAAALCEPVGDLRRRCFGGLLPQTRSFSGLEEEKETKCDKVTKTEKPGRNKSL